MQRNAAAANTPSGAPPMPISKSMPVSGLVVAIAAETSPSPIKRIRAPALRTSAMSASWRGRDKMITVRSSTLQLLRFRQGMEIFSRRFIEVDHPVTDRTDGDLGHIGIRAMKQIAAVGHGDHGERVGRVRWRRSSCLRADRGRCRLSARLSRLFRRYRASALRRARLRRSPRAVDRERIESLAHSIDRRLIGGLLIAAPGPAARS